MTNLLLQRISNEKRLLCTLAASPALRSPTAGFDDKRLRIADLSDRMLAAIKTHIVINKQSLNGVAIRLDSAKTARFKLLNIKLGALKEQLLLLDPLAVLERGYAAVFDAKGNAVVSATKIEKGSSLELRLADGTVKTTANEVDLWNK